MRSARVTLKRYAAYTDMNDRFHALILNACGKRMIFGGFEAVVEVNNADSQSRLATSTA